jgi:hypothetical protein
LVDIINVSNAFRAQQSLNVGGGFLCLWLVGLRGIWSYRTLGSISNTGFKGSDRSENVLQEKLLALGQSGLQQSTLRMTRTRNFYGGRG